MVVVVVAVVVVVVVVVGAQEASRPSCLVARRTYQVGPLVGLMGLGLGATGGLFGDTKWP